MNKVDRINEQGWQYCYNCDKRTLHTPKLGLIPLNKRLCTVCNHSNILKDERSK